MTCLVFEVKGKSSTGFRNTFKNFLQQILFFSSLFMCLVRTKLGIVLPLKWSNSFVRNFSNLYNSYVEESILSVLIGSVSVIEIDSSVSFWLSIGAKPFLVEKIISGIKMFPCCCLTRISLIEKGKLSSPSYLYLNGIAPVLLAFEFGTCWNVCLCSTKACGNKIVEDYILSGKHFSIMGGFIFDLEILVSVNNLISGLDISI